MMAIAAARDEQSPGGAAQVSSSASRTIAFVKRQHSRISVQAVDLGEHCVPGHRSSVLVCYSRWSRSSACVRSRSSISGKPTARQGTMRHSAVARCRQHVAVWICPARNPPQYALPAPVGSITFVGMAGT